MIFTFVFLASIAVASILRKFYQPKENHLVALGTELSTQQEHSRQPQPTNQAKPKATTSNPRTPK
jgi:hypothetical protein